MKSGNLTVIGTSHIAKESIEEIKAFFEEETPQIAALELDRQRYLALTEGKRQKPSLLMLPRVGLHGFIFLVMGHWAQGVLGRMVGVEPGSEMLTTIKQARKHKVPLALIDQDIQLTLKRFSTIPLREKARLAWDVLAGVFSRGQDAKKLGITSIDLGKVPDKALISRLMGMLRKRYPNLHRVLVEERNVYMAQNLSGILLANPDKKVLAVVGAGHEEEILNLVKLFLTHSKKLSAEAV
jgi:pheromone shutdown-related protein TraB